MRQLTAALAAPRLVRHARRALLLIGAAFVWWLLFSGGPAQADDGGSAHQALDPVTPVTQTTKAATDVVRSTPQRVAQRLATTTQEAPEPVRDVVDAATATLEAPLSATSATVADTLDSTVDHTVETVRPTLGTVTDAVATAVATRPAVPVAGAGRTSVRQHVPTAPAAAPGPLATAATLAVVDAPTEGRVGQAEGPSDRLPNSPAAPATPVAPSGGNSAAPGPLAALGGLLVLPPAVRRQRRLDGRQARRLDPAYAPGCSPD